MGALPHYALSQEFRFQLVLLLERLPFFKSFFFFSFPFLERHACCHRLAAEVIHSGWEKSSLLWWQGKEQAWVSIEIISTRNCIFIIFLIYTCIIWHTYISYKDAWLVLCNTIFAFWHCIFFLCANNSLFLYSQVILQTFHLLCTYPIAARDLEGDRVSQTGKLNLNATHPLAFTGEMWWLALWK